MSEANMATVVRNVQARGYIDGYSDFELWTRQVLKGAEELAELADCGLWRFQAYAMRDDIPADYETFMALLRAAASVARKLFDGGVLPDKPTGFVDESVVRRAMAEDADCAVVACVRAECYRRMLGATELPDILGLACAKSASDVRRGVRPVG